MILMLTLGLDIFLRGGTTLAIWGGGTSRSMELGVSYDPLFFDDIFISRIHLVGAGVALALFVAFMLFFRTGPGSSCGRSRMITWLRGR